MESIIVCPRGRVVGDWEVTPVLPFWSYFSIGGDSPGAFNGLMFWESLLVKGSWIVVFAGLLNSCAVISNAQVDVSVAPSKSLYIAGEPVFVVASIANTGTTPLTIEIGRAHV